MKQLINNTPPKDSRYINHIDCNNDCIGVEKMVGETNKEWLITRSVFLPTAEQTANHNRGVSVIKDVGLASLFFSSYKDAREYLNALDDTNKVYLFKSAKEMWTWLSNVYTK